MRWSAALVCLLFLPLVAVPTASAEAYTTEMKSIESHDGTTINARLYTPSVTPAPAILLTHGWNDNIDSTNTVAFAQRYAAAGYVVLSYDSRGWGKSGGDVELNGPNEVKDTQSLVTYLGKLDIVVKDGTEDPRVGMIGQSYSGGIQFLAAQEDDRIDAIAPFATWSNLLGSLAPNDVIKRSWVDLLFFSGQASARGVKLGETDPTKLDPNPSGPMNELTVWYAEIVAQNKPTDEVREELGVIRSLKPGVLDTPTFLVQGWPDTLFTPDHALATFHDLRSRGVDVRIAFINGGHGFGNYNTDETVMTQVDSFFAQHLRDELPSVTPYPVLRYRFAEDDVVGEKQWPPAGTQAGLWYLTDDGLAATAGSLEVTLTAPPIPAHCTEISNFQRETDGGCTPSMDGTYHTFATPPLDAAQEVTGAGQVVVPISSTQAQEAFLFFQLVDVDPDGGETTILAQVMPMRTPASSASAFVNLPAITHTFEKGHSIGLKISTTDLNFHGARDAGQITLGGNAPALVLLPLTPKDAHGDRVAPTIQRISSFGQVLDDDANNTQVLHFEVRDDLGIGAVDVTGDQADVTVRIVKSSAAKWDLDVTAVADVCDVGIVTLAVTDLAGNNATKSYSVVPCPPVPEPTVEPVENGKKSPGGWMLLPLLAAAFLRRRVA